MHRPWRLRFGFPPHLTRTRLVGAALLSLALGSPTAPAADTLTNEDCLACHAADAENVPAGAVDLEIDGVRPEVFDRSVHSFLSCTDCHADIGDFPHNATPTTPDCGSCHTDEAEQYSRSIHGVSHTMGASGAATCADCHGAHEIGPVNEANSPVFKLNLPRTCAKCHSNPGLTKEYEMKFPEAATQYMDSIHGRALLKMGLIVAPSCNNCHGVHDIKRAVDRGSPINHANIAKTCGTCHLGVEQTYERSIHGQLLAQGDPRGPVCTDCHTAHEIVNPEGGNFKVISDQRCGKCHEDRLAHYEETYHGKAMALGKPNTAPTVAACYDCHGYHDVLPPSNPASHLSRANILGTCQKCHVGATANFTLYEPHADPLDGEHYPELHAVFLFMTALLIGVFVFFGIHTLFWLVRSVYLYLHDTKTFREAKVATLKDDEQFTRFTPFERTLHLMVVTSFLLLVITGMPLKFYYTDWARAMFSLIGGPEVARSLHHFGAIVTFAYFVLHLSDLFVSLWRNRGQVRNPGTGRVEIRRIIGAMFGPDSLLPSLQDWRDFVAHQKWFFGKGAKPQFDRWTYWERFDYLAVFWGIFAIGVSGLIMWFPKFFSLFMPGWIINIALVVHSDEALLAAGFIFTFHFFNTHFRLEKFPMDTVIFSGRISKTEMLHERRRWYDRLVADGRLDAHRVRDDWEGRKNIARTMGFMFFGLGLVLLVLIVYAMASRLGH